MKLDLARGLARFGAPVLIDPAGGGSAPGSLVELMRGLVESQNALYRASVVPLVMVVDEAPRLRGRRFKLLYTAAACLQRLWRTRLARANDLPDRYSRELGLPPADVDYGRGTFEEVCRRLEPEMRGAREMIENVVRQLFAARELHGAAAR